MSSFLNAFQITKLKQEKVLMKIPDAKFIAKNDFLENEFVSEFTSHENI